MSEPSPTSNHPAAGDGERTTLADSPWLWLLLFSVMALIALQVMAQKYGQRQAQIEQQYQGRQWAHLQPASQGRDKQDVISFSSSDQVMIGLRPLRILAIALIALSGAMLFRQTRRASDSG